MFCSLQSAAKFMSGSVYFYISAFALSFVPLGFPIAGIIALAFFLIVTFLDHQLGKSASKEDKIILARLEAGLFALTVSVLIIFAGWPDADLSPIGEFLMVIGFQTVIYYPVMIALLFLKLPKIKP
jgi:quinol-cytochrome oxidoreductase complex cytochrome b subunit